MANIRYVPDPNAKPKAGAGAGAAPAAAATTTATMTTATMSTTTSTDGAGAHSRQSSAEPSHGDANAEHPNDGSGDHRPTKKRKVLSCFPCRDRKMKCDRGYPICGRCERTGRNGQCTYDPRLLDDAHAATANPMRHVSAASGYSGYTMSSSMSVAAAEGLVHRAIGAKVPDRRFESLAHAGDVPRLVSPFKAVLRSGAYSEKGEGRLIEDMMFRGKGFKSMFAGSTSVFAIISKFPELKAFTFESVAKDQRMVRVRIAIKDFRKVKKALADQESLAITGSDAEVIALVPEKATVDAAVSLYFQQFENTWRVIQSEAFKKDYWAFWEREKTASFAVLLLLMIATTKCLVHGQRDTFTNDSAVSRDEAALLVQYCDAWLHRCARMRPSLSIFQLRILSLIAKKVNCLQVKQDWANAGDLLRSALSAGLHRDVSLMHNPNISEYDKEMRRRIWATIAEFELQSSIDAGFPSQLSAVHSDAEPPTNIPDEAFSPDTARLPAARPLDSYTRVTYLVRSAASLPLRVHLARILNDPSARITYDDVQRYDAELNAHLRSNPRNHTTLSRIAYSLLDLQLYQFLLMLHRPYAKLAFEEPRYAYSIVATMTAGNAIVHAHQQLLDYGIAVLNHARNDVLRVVMTLAQVVYTNASFGEPSAAAPDTSTSASASSAAPSAAPSPFLDPPTTTAAAYAPASAQDPPTAPRVAIPALPRDPIGLHTTTVCIAILDTARALFDAKVRRLGTAYMEHWLVTAARCLMPALDASEQGDVRRRGELVMERVVKLWEYVLERQREGESEREFARRLWGCMGVSVGGNSGAVNGNGGRVGTGGGGGLNGAVGAGLAGGMRVGSASWDGLEDLEMGDIDLAWAFPDWTFDFGADF